MTAGTVGLPSSSAEPGAQGPAASIPKGSIWVAGQKIQEERCWHDQRTTPQDKELPMTGRTQASVLRGCPRNVRRGSALGGEGGLLLIESSRSSNSTDQALGPAVQGSSSTDTGCAGYMCQQSSPPARPPLPTPGGRCRWRGRLCSTCRTKQSARRDHGESPLSSQAAPVTQAEFWLPETAF